MMLLDHHVDPHTSSNAAPMHVRLQQRRRNKEHRWAVDDLERELAAVGLRIKSIEPDGNCFFRAVLDQTEVGSQLPAARTQRHM